MRSALMMHANADLNSLAKQLIQSITCNAAEALRMPCGSLEKDKYADFIVSSLPQKTSLESLILQLILHTKTPEIVIINGIQI